MRSKIKQQGDKVRNMKGASIEKEVKEEIDELLELKRKYKSRSGKDYESSAT